MEEPRKPRFAEMMDNIVFDWVDEIPKTRGRGYGVTAEQRHNALLKMVRSRPDKVFRLTGYYDYSMRHYGTTIRQHLKKINKTEDYTFGTRKELGKDNEIEYVFYITYIREDEDD